MISPELARLVRLVIARRKRAGDPGPAYPDDVADCMDYELTDGQLAVICRAAPGPPVWHRFRALRWSCQLRKRLFEELADVELGRCPAAVGDLVALDLGIWPTEPADFLLRPGAACRHRPCVPIKRLVTVRA